jgi:hypothetical protein
MMTWRVNLLPQHPIIFLRSIPRPKCCPWAKLSHFITMLPSFCSCANGPDPTSNFPRLSYAHESNPLTYKKMAQVMQYHRATRDMPLTLEASTGINIIKWWVDASFAVHPDMLSHMGAMMTLGSRAIYAMLRQQRLNVTSSTEGELEVVADAMAQIIWTRYFLEAQGYPVDDSVLYQDNQSAMLLKKKWPGVKQ